MGIQFPPIAFLYQLYIYKLSKIVRVLWLAERSVCMRVCKHGCGFKMFCFSRASHASTNLKKFSSSKLHKFTLFTHSFVGWNLENRCKEGVSIFFRLSWHFMREKSVFWKASFCKTRTDYACKTSFSNFTTPLSLEVEFAGNWKSTYLTADWWHKRRSSKL